MCLICRSLCHDDLVRIPRCEYASQLLVAQPTGKHRTSNESPNFCTYDKLFSVEFSLGLIAAQYGLAGFPQVISVVLAGRSQWAALGRLVDHTRGLDYKIL